MAQSQKGLGPTVQIGYVNKNNQKVIGPTGKSGTDYNQYEYEVECQDCLHRYGANGSDIHDRKCPKCGGGKPGL